MKLIRILVAIFVAIMSASCVTKNYYGYGAPQAPVRTTYSGFRSAPPATYRTPVREVAYSSRSYSSQPRVTPYDIYARSGNGYNGSNIYGTGGNYNGNYSRGSQSRFIPAPPGSHILPNGYFDRCEGTGFYAPRR